MAEKKQMVVYAAAYETVAAALSDLDAIEQLHKERDDRPLRRGRDRQRGRQPAHS